MSGLKSLELARGPLPLLKIESMTRAPIWFPPPTPPKMKLILLAMTLSFGKIKSAKNEDYWYTIKWFCISLIDRNYK